ncbi:MAG: YqaE/Pmp3 family membrane protein [Acidimicrobiales bacterium]
MEFLEIVLSLLLPPLAVALRRGTTGMQIGLTFLLWLCGWFPGVIYALWLVTADCRSARGTPEYVAQRTEARRAQFRSRTGNGSRAA